MPRRAAHRIARHRIARHRIARLRIARLRNILVALLTFASGVCADVPTSDAPTSDEVLRGRALFEGRIDLQGRIYTHLVDLPPEIVRCSNCHAVAGGPDVPRSLAPRLTHELLLQAQRRRGGPPSRYDRDRFCALLRRGVDPALVLVSVEMPRYALDDASCQALWLYLTGNAVEARAH